MLITDHFTIMEFARTTRFPELQEKNLTLAHSRLGNLLACAKELEKLRVFIARPVYITSGIRCPELNTAVGGAENSDHLNGDAVDFTVKDFQDPTGLRYIFDWCSYHLDYRQLILERPEGRRPWIHLGRDLGDGRPRQVLMYDGKGYAPYA